MKHSIRVVSHRPELAARVVASLSPERAEVFDGTGFPSFSRLVNQCAQDCPAETVVICADKVRPTQGGVRRLLALLDEGHGLVGLYRFAFFGFRKELFRRVGPFDERFVGGENEDTDIVLRMREADISYHSEESVAYRRRPSTWDNTLSKRHDAAKWDRSNQPECVRRRFDEETYGYDWGPSQPCDFLPFSRSTLLPHAAWLLEAEVA